MMEWNQETFDPKYICRLILNDSHGEYFCISHKGLDARSGARQMKQVFNCVPATDRKRGHSLQLIHQMSKSDNPPDGTAFSFVMKSVRRSMIGLNSTTTGQYSRPAI